MEKNYKISIPEPCHEDWNKMTPKENGRFCMNCSKTVTDFTSMLPQEIQQFFIQNQNNKICGRFRKSQLDTLIIQIPDRILYSQTNYHKIFLLALFIAMGTTLFSCADNEGNKQKIDKIEIVEDTPKEKIDQTVEDSVIEKPKPELVKISPLIALEEPSGSSGRIDSYISGDIIARPVCSIDKLPDYPGGSRKFTEFIQNEFTIPKKARRAAGEMEVSFVIDKTGTLNQIKVFDNIGYETGEEVIRVLQKSKKWVPGMVEGKAVNTPFKLNIVLQKDSLNSERKKRKLSKIVSIEFVKQNDMLVSQAN
ncbi:energy transducer TonB [Flavobacterium notoginsengisoli]|uniref:energy transducer TonB n=1 Tax=Flavobacterium notoginsengisoli TaxID=1478199 RepID=UPI0036375A30